MPDATLTQPQVFISYATPDAAVAFRVCEYLEGEGLKCWIAPRDVSTRAGTPWADEIALAIETTEVVLVVVSSRTNASDHVPKELDAAVRNRKRLLPVVLDEAASISRGIAYYIGNLQWVVSSRAGLDGTLPLVTAAARNDPNWEQVTVAPSRWRRLRYHRDAFLTTVGGSFLAVIVAAIILYAAWNTHMRVVEKDRNSSFMALGYVDLAPGIDVTLRRGETSLTVWVYLYAPDVRFRNVQLLLDGATIRDSDRGDLTSQFAPDALASQTLHVGARSISDSITTCLILPPREDSRSRFRVTQVWHVTPEKSDTLGLIKAASVSVKSEDGSVCGESTLGKVAK